MTSPEPRPHWEATVHGASQRDVTPSPPPCAALAAEEAAPNALRWQTTVDEAGQPPDHLSADPAVVVLAAFRSCDRIGRLPDPRLGVGLEQLERVQQELSVDSEDRISDG